MINLKAGQGEVTSALFLQHSVKGHVAFCRFEGSVTLELSEKEASRLTTLTYCFGTTLITAVRKLVKKKKKTIKTVNKVVMNFCPNFLVGVFITIMAFM